MNVHPAYEAFLELLHTHWMSAFFILLTVVTLLVLFGFRWWLRRRLQKLLEERFEEENELDRLPSPGPTDQEALALIKSLRSEVWELPESELLLSVDALMQRGMGIVRSVAAVYHSGVDAPQYAASMAEMLQMIHRISARLAHLSTAAPFNILGNRKLSEYQRYYEVYRKINENPILQLLKRNPQLYKVARWAMNIKNLGNPLYWAGRELSREGYFFLLRWFYLSFTSQVGREAMRLYSGRHFQTEEDRDAALVCYRLYAFTRQWGGPSAVEWSILVNYVTHHAALESTTQLHILSRWSQDRLPKELNEQTLQTRSGIKWYKEGLKRLLDGDKKPIPLKSQLIREEIAAMDREPNGAADAAS